MHDISTLSIGGPFSPPPSSFAYTDIPYAHIPTPERPVRACARSIVTGERIAWQQHPWAQLAYATRGVLRMSAGGCSWIVPPSRAVWIPAHLAHEIVAIESACLRVLHIDASIVPHALARCRVVEVSGLMREAIAASDGVSCTPARERLLGELTLDELARAVPLPLAVPLPRDPRLRALCEALLAAPANAGSLGEWAAQSGISARTVSRLFRAELGMSFSQWRRQAGLARAIPLLNQKRSLAQVARELGYRSQSAFTAMFGRAFGESPRAFMSRAAAFDVDATGQRRARPPRIERPRAAAQREA